jgi:peptidyl-prolyl cis-trans isomerase A (cyclophilin A)
MKLTPSSLLIAAVSALSVLSAQAGPKVLMKTTQGDITIELNEEKAPETVKNFLAYVNEGFFDKTVFHRVIDGFMIQGGGFALKEDGSIEQKETKAPIQNEAKNGLKNKKGTIAMARTGDPHSATAQFFINHKDNDNLDYPSFDGWGYAVFGEVVGGLDVIEKIAKAPTGTKTLKARAGGALREAPMEDVPNETIVIESVKVVTE